MSRVIVFIAVFGSIMYVLTLNSFRKQPVSNKLFDIKNASVEVAKVEDAVMVQGPHPGEKVYKQCIMCHGKDGQGSVPMKAPRISGQYDWYLLKQLTDMKSGARDNPTMAPIVKGLSDQDVKDVAAYVATLSWKK